MSDRNTGSPEARLPPLGNDIEVPRDNGELVFAEPWEARAFGMAVALSEQGRYPWHDFSEVLAAKTAAAEGDGVELPYYERWLSVLETLALERGLVSEAELAARTAQYHADDHDDHHHWHDGHEHD
ncbi:MAG: nitrile hydratase accessory protein [Gammaproteobacteria bacterium]|nr:nitrile hydratase accessory protein [Gammaproteobacteria bacterium]